MSCFPEVLIVSSQIQQCKPLVLALDREGVRTRVAFTAADAQETLRQTPITVTFSGMELPDGNYLELLRWILENRVATRFVVMSTVEDWPKYLEAMENGAYDFLPLPCRDEEITRILRQALENLSGGAKSLAASA